jgi:hypothetical protein
MVRPSANRCNFIAILCVSLVIFAVITLCVASQPMFVVVVVVVDYYRLSPESFRYTLVCCMISTETLICVCNIRFLSAENEHPIQCST